jgi:hypothetical protein
MSITELNREFQEANEGNKFSRDRNESFSDWADRNTYLLLWLIENLEQIQGTLQITERMIGYCKRNSSNLQHEKLMDYVRQIEEVQS